MATETQSLQVTSPSEQRTSDIIKQITDPASSAPSYRFAFSGFLKREYRFGLAPNRPLCKAFREGHCPLGNDCPDKHQMPQSNNNLVCKHWLRGLCKKGDGCEFLHEYNVRRMPECKKYSTALYCPNGDECLYQHIDPEQKIPPCPHYDQGFCPLGPRCSKKHIRRQLCSYYLAGFCPSGRQCKEGSHPRFDKDLPKPTVKVEKTPEEIEAEKQRIREEAEREDERDAERGGRRGGRRFGGRRRF